MRSIPLAPTPTTGQGQGMMSNATMRPSRRALGSSLLPPRFLLASTIAAIAIAAAATVQASEPPDTYYLPYGSRWTPRSRYWLHIDETESGLWEYDPDLNRSTDRYRLVQNCLADALPQETVELLNRPASWPKSTVADTLLDTDSRTTLLVEVQNAILPYQVEAVKTLAACVNAHVPSKFEHRVFDSDGGNDVTFLAVLLPLFLPQVAANVQRIAELAYRESSWSPEDDDEDDSSDDSSDDDDDDEEEEEGYRSNKARMDKDEDYYPKPGTLGIRTSEYLSYQGFKNLGAHGDTGSTYTVLFALSDSKSYKGGEYYIHDTSYNPHYFKARQYSAIVFLSDFAHGVTDIESGHREMFTNELWIYDDVPLFRLRPNNEEMELFQERTRGLDPADADEVNDSKFPTKEETQAWLKETGREGLANGVYGAAGEKYSNEGEEEEDSSDDGEDGSEDDSEDDGEDGGEEENENGGHGGEL